MCWRRTQQSVAWDRQFFVESEILFKLRTAMPNTIYIRPESLSFCRDYWRRPLGIDIKRIFVSLSVKENGPCALRKRKGPSNFNRKVVVMFIQRRLTMRSWLIQSHHKILKSLFQQSVLAEATKRIKMKCNYGGKRSTPSTRTRDSPHWGILMWSITSHMLLDKAWFFCCCCFIFIFVSF